MEELDKTILDKISDYIENTPFEAYIDYRDELCDEDIQALLEGSKTLGDIQSEIEDNYFQYMDFNDYYDYWSIMADDLELSQEQLDIWVDSDHREYPHVNVDMDQLIRNTSSKHIAMYVRPNFAEKVQQVGKLVKSDEYTHEGLADDLQAGNYAFLTNDTQYALEFHQDMQAIIPKGTNYLRYDSFNGCGITGIHQLENDLAFYSGAFFLQVDESKEQSGYGIQECYGFSEALWTN